MKIVVPALDLDCPAALAMDKEGLLFDTIIMEYDHSYGTLLASLWHRPEGFIIIEHDVVPWPGALYAMMECGHDWCSHGYLRAPHNIIHSLGCIKVDQTIQIQNPDLPYKYNWHNTLWNELDGSVIPALLSTGAKCHIHEPPFAHVKK